MSQDVFVAWALREAGQLVGVVSALNEPEQLQAMDHAIERNAQIVDSWVQRRGGKVMMNVCLVGFFSVPAERCQELSDLVSLISDERTEYNFGVGLDVQEAHNALTHGQKADDPVALYTDDMAADAEQEPIKKSEEEGEEKVDDSDPRVKILKALKGIQAQAPAIEGLRAHNEPAYRAVKSIVDAMIHMARGLKKAEGEPQASPVFRRKGVKPLRFPPAPAIIGTTGGSVNDGKIKVNPLDMSNGAPKNQGWNQVRAGMIMSRSGSAISSREPQTE